METIHPSSLGKCGTATDATGVYDWASQSYKYDNTSFGTYHNTRNGTSSYNSCGTVISNDDSNQDSYSD